MYHLLGIQMDLVNVLLIPIKNHLTLFGRIIVIPGPRAVATLAVRREIIKTVHGKIAYKKCVAFRVSRSPAK